MTGASATISVGSSSQTFDNILGGLHAEMNGLNQMSDLMSGQDVIISNVTGHFYDGIDRPVGMCVNCRTDMFDVLEANGAKSVTLTVTKSNVKIENITIPRENFGAVQQELDKIKNSIKGNRQRSDKAWEVLEKHSLH